MTRCFRGTCRANKKMSRVLRGKALFGTGTNSKFSREGTGTESGPNVQNGGRFKCCADLV